MSLREAVKLPPQELFDKVKDHLLMQNEPALMTLPGPRMTPSCAYRAGTLSCAVGCLISDEEYSLGFEGYAIEDIFDALRIEASGSAIDLLESLQRVHDFHHPEDWPARLKAVAEKYDLIYA